MREFKALPEFTFRMGASGDTVPVMTMDGVTGLAAPAMFIAQRFGQDANACARTAFAGLVRAAGVGSTRLESDMRTYHGLADEVVPESVATILGTGCHAIVIESSVLAMFRLPRVSVNFPAVTETVAVPLKAAFGVKVAV